MQASLVAPMVGPIAGPQSNLAAPQFFHDCKSMGAPPGATFSRGTGAMQFASDGTLKWAPENLLLQSQTFENASWFNNNGGTGSAPVRTANDAVAPDGTTTADKLVFNSGAGTTGSDYSRLGQAISPNLTGATYRLKMWVKGTVGQQIYVNHVGANGYGTAVTFDGTWQQLTIDEVHGGGSPNLVFGLRRGGSITNTSVTMWAWGAQLYRLPNANETYVATTSAAYYGPRFDYDPVSLSPLGYLVEMASTNTITRSQEFDAADWTTQNSTVTANQATAPDGTATADKVTENSSATVLHAVFNRSAMAGNSVAGFSCFFKAGTRSKFYICMRGTTNDWVTAVFDTVGGTTAASQTSTGATSGTLVSTYMRSVGNGWYRCSLIAQVVTANAFFFVGLAPLATGNSFSGNGDVTYTGDGSSYGYFWGAQADSAGVGVTSYIPTAGATVTRNQDVLSLPLTSLPGWDATKGGVLVAAYRLHTIAPSGGQGVAWLLNGGGTDYIALLANYSGTSTRRSFTRSGGVGQIDVGSGISSPAVFARTKQALGWGTSRGFLSVDGATTAGVSGSYSLPVGPSPMYFGGYDGTSQLNGTLESIAYYRGSRDDNVVKAVSVK